MATEHQRRYVQVRFTGARTGLGAIVIKGVGRVSQGEQFSATEDDAARYATPLVTRTGFASDFEIVPEAAETEVAVEAPAAPEADADPLPEEIAASPAQAPDAEGAGPEAPVMFRKRSRRTE